MEATLSCIYDARKGREDVVELYFQSKMGIVLFRERMDWGRSQTETDDVMPPSDFTEVDKAIVERWSSFDLFAIKAKVDEIMYDEEFCENPGPTCKHYRERLLKSEGV